MSSVPPPSDEALMQALQDGDLNAYDALVGRYQARLFHFVLRRVRDRGLAEDLVQESLLKLWRHRASFRHGSRVSTWLFALTLNLCRDHWRRVKPESSMERPEVAFAAELKRLDQPAPDALDQVQQRELAERLLDALEQLPPVSAQLLKQRSAEGLTLEEAGKRLGLSPEAARAAASRAYKKLRDLLKQDRD
jgi:RNA polymerase sigma-70 factor (ECF subfamily)